MIKKLLLSMTVLVLLVSCGQKEETGAIPLEPKIILGIEIARVKSIRVEKVDTFSGTVIPNDQVMISPKVVGYLKDVKVRPGDKVKRGQVLATIENSDIRPDVEKARAGLKEIEAALNEIERAVEEVQALKSAAQANYELANKTFERFKELYEANATSSQQFDEVKAKLEEARAHLKAVKAKEAQLLERKKALLAKKEQIEADLSKAKVYLGYTYVKSPVNGIVLRKLVDRGNLVSPQTPILAIGSYPLRVRAYIDNSYFRKIKVGNTLKVRINGKTYLGRVSEIDKSADPLSHKFGIKIDVGYANILPGSYAVVEVPIKKERALIIPASALYRVGSLEYVFVIKDGRAELRLIKTGKKIGDKYVVLSGLKEGEKIATSNLESLRDGARV